MAKRHPKQTSPSEWVVGDPLAVRDPPAGSELAVVERAVRRTITEMEAGGAVPLGMVRALQDTGWEDILLVYRGLIQCGLMFDAAGYGRSIYLSETGRLAGPEHSDPTPETEQETFQRILLRAGQESSEADRQEVGIRFVKIFGIEGLEVHSPEFGSSACFAFDRAGALWGLWYGWDHGALAGWLQTTIPRLKREGRI